jgi:hypothetical protein
MTRESRRNEERDKVNNGIKERNERMRPEDTKETPFSRKEACLCTKKIRRRDILRFFRGLSQFIQENTEYCHELSNSPPGLPYITTRR